MRKTTLNITNFAIIFLLLLSILFLIKIIVEDSKINHKLNVTENFNSNLEDLIGSTMEQRPERQRQEAVLDSAHESIDMSRDKQGKLRFQSADAGGNLMDKYIQDIILSDVGNPNKVFIENDSNQLPTVIEDNLPQYNHEMRKLTDAKMIKQKYTIGVLKYKINELLSSIKSIEQIKDDMEALKLPENANILAILKKQ